MYKIMMMIRRRPDLSWEEFSAYWRDRHGPLVRDIPELSKHVISYVQHHVRPRPGNGLITCDGIAEISFTDKDAAKAFFSAQAFVDLVKPDEANFIAENDFEVMLVDDALIV